LAHTFKDIWSSEETQYCLLGGAVLWSSVPICFLIFRNFRASFGVGRLLLSQGGVEVFLFNRRCWWTERAAGQSCGDRCHCSL